MNAVDEIEDAIRKLPDEDQATLRAWFAEFDAATWDRQFERDVADGRLDALADEALRDRREGCRLPSPWIRKHAAVTDAARYIKLVEWSEEDGAFVGQCPGIIGPCCHGSDEVEVYRELCEIVEEWIEIARREGHPLPPATAGTGFARPMA